VAVPFGVGGLCCCLFDAPVREVAAAHAPSCCSEPAPSDQPAGGEREDGDCSCPSREAALSASPVPSDAPLSPASGPLVTAVAPAAESAVRGPAANPRLRRVPHPPPKLPLHRTLCVLLC
jgi:hypothetical protein